MGIADVISLLGGIALFLYGMAVMGDNLKKAVSYTHLMCSTSPARMVRRNP